MSFFLVRITVAASDIAERINNPPRQNVSAGARALLHLCQQMDAFDPYFIYRDFAWGGNADFVPSGWMGDWRNLYFDPAHTATDALGGETCLKIGYAGRTWAGICWQRMDEKWEIKDKKSMGVNLSAARRLLFRARAEDNRTAVEIGLGGNTGDYPESSQKHTRDFFLSKKWQEYSLDVSNLDLSNVIGAFLVVLEMPGTVYLDNIRYDIDRDPARYHFAPSYPVSLNSPLYPASRNAAHLYDTALMLIALSAGSDDPSLPMELRSDAKRRVEVLAESIIFAMENDRNDEGYLLRNVYWGGADLADYNGEARLPGWWNGCRKEWQEDEYSVSSYTGNLAWAALALIEAWETVEDRKDHGRYLEAAKRLMLWIERYTRADKVDKEWYGFTGGFRGWEKSSKQPSEPEQLLWRSTEHNADVLAVARRLAEANAEDGWQHIVDRASYFLKEMFDGSSGYFWTGTKKDGSINKDPIPLDAQTFVALALGDDPMTQRAVSWAKNNLNAHEVCGENEVTGYAFSSHDLGVWPEGTAQMGLAYMLTGHLEEAETCRATLRKIQSGGPGTNYLGLIAACRSLKTGFTGGDCKQLLYYPKLHIGATAWFYLMERGYNPFTGKLIPRSGEAFTDRPK